MTTLRSDQARKLLSCLGEVYACHDLDTFANQLLSSLHRAIPSDVAIYNELNLGRKRLVGLSWPYEVPWPNSAQARLFFSQHPFLQFMRQTGDVPSLRVSDFLTPTQWRESALYREAYSRLGFEYQLGCALPHPTLRRMLAVSCIRKLSDFSDSEKTSLELMRSHFLQAYRNAEVVSLLQAELSLTHQALEHSRRGLILIHARGAVRFCSAPARRWLKEYFGRAPREGSRLPERLRTWLRLQQLPAPRTGDRPPARRPLITERPGRQLTVRILPQPGGESMLLLEERRTELSAEPLQHLGLTPREGEVLLWVAQGKTNSEIGIILGRSAGTVHKHLEHIFEKLGVETRTAAAAQALAAMHTTCD